MTAALGDLGGLDLATSGDRDFDCGGSLDSEGNETSGIFEFFVDSLGELDFKISERIFAVF